MSKGRSKHMADYYASECPEPKEGEKIAKVVQPMGSNQVQIERQDGTVTLCLLPAKFRKKFWLKRGSFVIIEEAQTAKSERVSGTISHVLLPQHEKKLRKKPDIWPNAFTSKDGEKGEARDCQANSIDRQDKEGKDENDDNEASGAIVENRNRRVVRDRCDTDSDEYESSEEVRFMTTSAPMDPSSSRFSAVSPQPRRGRQIRSFCALSFRHSSESE